MAYINDSPITIINRLSSASSFAKAELYETYDRLRDLTVSGPAMGGSGLGPFSGMLLNLGRMIGGAPFIPTFGSEAMNIPGTSYYAPISGGTGMVPGGQAAFGLGQFAQQPGFPAGGAAPISGDVDALSVFFSNGSGAATTQNLGFSGLGDVGFPNELGLLGSLSSLPQGGIVAGGASGLSNVATAGGLAAGTAAGAGFGRNWVMPAAGIASGIGGLLTTLGPFFGPFGIAAAAGGAVLNGAAGAVLQSFQHVASRILVNADTILTNKAKNLETVVKMFEAQQSILQKLLKEDLEGDKKALDNIT